MLHQLLHCGRLLVYSSCMSLRDGSSKKRLSEVRTLAYNDVSCRTKWAMIFIAGDSEQTQRPDADNAMRFSSGPWLYLIHSQLPNLYTGHAFLTTRWPTESQTLLIGPAYLSSEAPDGNNTTRFTRKDFSETLNCPMSGKLKSWAQSLSGVVTTKGHAVLAIATVSLWWIPTRCWVDILTSLGTTPIL